MNKKLLKLFYAITLSIVLTSFPAKAWLNMPFNTSYDNNFQPTISVPCNNGNNKTITSIEFVVVSKLKYASNNDILAKDFVYKSVSVSIVPHASKNVKFACSLKKEYQITSVAVSKVRFSDGSIKEY